MKTKKGQLEVSFNWIFILIAGAAILFFFIRLITQETDTASDVMTQRTAIRLEEIITVMQQNPDSLTMMDPMRNLLEFECNVEGHSFKVEGARSSQYLSTQLLFSPRKIGESRPIAWVKTFNAPYPVESIMYLTDQNTKYVFIKDGGGTTTVDPWHDKLPDNITKRLISGNEVDELNHEGYHNFIIILDETYAGKNNFKFDPRVAEKISYGIAIAENKIIFYELKSTGSNKYKFEAPETTKFVTEEFALGAILSGDPDLYGCTEEKMMEQLRIATSINLERISLLNEGYGVHRCSSLYSSITQTYFEDLISAINDDNGYDYEDIRSNINNIRQLNNRMIRDGCVVIY